MAAINTPPLDMDTNHARAIAEAFGFRPFCRESSDPKYDAQRNLSGRSHYVDDDTLKAFHARVQCTKTAHGGAIFAIVESSAKDACNHARGFRFVVFDLSGRVVNDRDDWHKSTAKASQAYADWLAEFDVIAHYAQRLQDERRAISRKLDDIAKAETVIRHSV